MIYISILLIEENGEKLRVLTVRCQEVAMRGVEEEMLAEYIYLVVFLQ